MFINQREEDYFRKDQIIILKGLIEQLMLLIKPLAYYLSESAYDEISPIISSLKIEKFTTSDKVSLKKEKNIDNDQKYKESHGTKHTQTYEQILENINNPDMDTIYINIPKTYFTTVPKEKVSNTQFQAIRASFNNMLTNFMILIGNFNLPKGP